jgi:uncharacterized membrane protein YfcA
MTPFLIFLGVPPAYAVANEANNILATSVSGSTTHYLKNTLDYKMGFNDCYWRNDRNISWYLYFYIF